MGNALFYHLARSPAEDLLPVLIDRSLRKGWRVELRGTDPGVMEMLDQKLWQAEGFLPHGLAGGPHDARQPVLLTVAGQPAGNRPACLMTLGGADVSVEECGPLERCCILFDGGHAPALNRAREQWKILTAGGVMAEYWSEESGRWERKR